MALHFGKADGGKIHKLSAERAVLIVGILTRLNRHILNFPPRPSIWLQRLIYSCHRIAIPFCERPVIGQNCFHIHETAFWLQVLIGGANSARFASAPK